MNFQQRLQVFWADLAHFPWRDTLLTLRGRFREDHMGLTASSLTFTTTIALVPFFTVALAVFTAFPMFSKMQGALQGWLIDSLIPDNIARQVLGYLTQFSKQANKLGVAGLGVLLVTAIALILTNAPLHPARADLLVSHHSGARAAGGEPGAYVVSGGCHQRPGRHAAFQPEILFDGISVFIDSRWPGGLVPLCAQHLCEMVTRLGRRHVCSSGH
jgi:hypothetical protein